MRQPACLISREALKEESEFARARQRPRAFTLAKREPLGSLSLEKSGWGFSTHKRLSFETGVEEHTLLYTHKPDESKRGATGACFAATEDTRPHIAQRNKQNNK